MTRAGIISRAVFALTVLALLAQAFLPAGFMPDARGGKVALVICTGSGPQTVMVDAKDVPVPQHPVHRNACAYAAVLAQGLQPQVSVPLPVAAFLEEAALPLAAVVLKAAFRPWFSRGPPLRV